VYAQFLLPFEPDLAGADRLYIAADGPLFLVPFEALRTPRSRYLVEEREIEMLRDARALVAARRPDAPIRSGVIVVDDIDYGRNARGPNLFRPLGAAESNAILPVLRRSTFGAVTFMRGATATKSWLMNLQTAPRILHLSTHGYYWSGFADRADPMRLGLIALAGANSDLGRGNSGILTGTEMMRLRLAGTDLVVLSACDSAQGEATYADGLAGLSSALAIAGVRRSLLALWPVSDAGTAVLMRRFYEHLIAQPDRYAAALRATKLDAIHGNLPQPPNATDWKAFVLIRN
jgi:CHAT domain-containing protein